MKCQSLFSGKNKKKNTNFIVFCEVKVKQTIKFDVCPTCTVRKKKRKKLCLSWVIEGVMVGEVPRGILFLNIGTP